MASLLQQTDICDDCVARLNKGSLIPVRRRTAIIYCQCNDPKPPSLPQRKPCRHPDSVDT
jgi:hypothetical protein